MLPPLRRLPLRKIALSIFLEKRQVFLKFFFLSTNIDCKSWWKGRADAGRFTSKTRFLDKKRSGGSPSYDSLERLFSNPCPGLSFSKKAKEYYIIINYYTRNVFTLTIISCHFPSTKHFYFWIIIRIRYSFNS